MTPIAEINLVTVLLFYLFQDHKKYDAYGLYLWSANFGNLWGSIIGPGAI